MEAAMLPENAWHGVPFSTSNRWPKRRGESGEIPVIILNTNVVCRQACNLPSALGEPKLYG